MPVRLVLDTNVVASALLWGGTPRLLLQAAREKQGVVIGTALAGKADLIVTGDKPLLTVSEHQGVKIVGVGQATEVREADSKT